MSACEACGGGLFVTLCMMGMSWACGLICGLRLYQIVFLHKRPPEDEDK